MSFQRFFFGSHPGARILITLIEWGFASNRPSTLLTSNTQITLVTER